jgi:hypothetical protein
MLLQADTWQHAHGLQQSLHSASPYPSAPLRTQPGLHTQAYKCPIQHLHAWISLAVQQLLRAVPSCLARPKPSYAHPWTPFHTASLRSHGRPSTL